MFKVQTPLPNHSLPRSPHLSSAGSGLGSKGSRAGGGPVQLRLHEGGCGSFLPPASRNQCLSERACRFGADGLLPIWRRVGWLRQRYD